MSIIDAIRFIKIKNFKTRKAHLWLRQPYGSTVLTLLSPQWLFFNTVFKSWSITDNINYLFAIKTGPYIKRKSLKEFVELSPKKNLVKSYPDTHFSIHGGAVSTLASSEKKSRCTPHRFGSLFFWWWQNLKISFKLDLVGKGRSSILELWHMAQWNPIVSKV